MLKVHTTSAVSGYLDALRGAYFDALHHGGRGEANAISNTYFQVRQLQAALVCNQPLTAEQNTLLTKITHTMKNTTAGGRLAAADTINERLSQLIERMPGLINTGLITREEALARYFALETLMLSLQGKQIRADHRQSDEKIIEQLDVWASELIAGATRDTALAVKQQIQMIYAMKEYVTGISAPQSEATNNPNQTALFDA